MLFKAGSECDYTVWLTNVHYFNYHHYVSKVILVIEMTTYLDDPLLHFRM